MTGESPPDPMAVVALPGSEELAGQLAESLAARLVDLEHRRFPDGETYLRLHGAVDASEVVLVARLDRPDERIPAVLFAADLLRDLGARRVGLVCPYLPYMRQDKRFRPGEALTSQTFARWLSAHFDWLVTVDPHLHRYSTLGEIYTLEARTVTAAPLLAEWIGAHVADPVLIGPDEESEQWVREVAAPGRLPWRVMRKRRSGDRAVTIALPELGGLAHHTPVLVDDIVSSGTTLAEAARQLGSAGMAAPVCVAVHGLFAAGARETLERAGIVQVVCTDTVAVPESEIRLASLLADAVAAR